MALPSHPLILPSVSCSTSSFCLTLQKPKGGGGKA